MIAPIAHALVDSDHRSADNQGAVAGSLGLVSLLQEKKSLFVPTATAQAISTTTNRTHKVEPEVVDIRFSAFLKLREIGMAADARPHAAQCTPARRMGAASSA